MDAKSVLIDALDTYSSEIEGEHKGEVTSLLNQIDVCKKYVQNNDVTVGWIRSHYMILIPAIKPHRVFLKQMIEDADRNNEERLAGLRAESKTLQAYYALLKPFQKFMP